MEEDFFRKVNEFMSGQMERANRMPLEEFENLSPTDMHGILYQLFKEGSYEKRFFERFLDFYGFVELEKIRKKSLADNPVNVTVTPLFRSVFELEPGNFHFLKTNNEA